MKKRRDPQTEPDPASFLNIGHIGRWHHQDLSCAAVYVHQPLSRGRRAMRLFPDRSTVKSRVLLQAITKFPSTFRTSLSRRISINSSLGQEASIQATPFPLRLKLNSPSPPATARGQVGPHDCFVLQAGLTGQEKAVVQDHRAAPVSHIQEDQMPVGGLQYQDPVSCIFRLMVDSPLAFPRTAFPKKSPTPLIPVVAFTFPSIHCMAPAWIVTGDWLRSQTS